MVESNGTGKIRGRIKALKKNYGFIHGIDNNDYFFHWTYLLPTTKTFNQLTPGMTVDFKPQKMEGDKDRALDIVAID